MINKLRFFILITILFIYALTFETTNYILLIILYIIFILVGLYDLGKDEIDE